MPYFITLAAFLVFSGFSVSAASTRDFTTFNPSIAWVSYQEYQAIDLSTNQKPILFLMTQPWCGACKRLKQSFVDDGTALAEASKNYLMVSIDGDDNDTLSGKFSPDGSYVPRILFASPNGVPNAKFKAPGGNPKYNYFYTHATQVARALNENYSTLSQVLDTKTEL